MQPNPLRTRLASGETLVGIWINLIHNPAILMLMKSAGVDFTRLDMEHSAASIETVANFALVARALDFPLMVRPPRSNREWITRLLDIGIWNLHCPQIESTAHAREVVSASRYAPRGLRGSGGMHVSTEFERNLSNKQRDSFANGQVYISAMLETGKVFDDLDAITSMDGIDALTFGPHDLAQDLGVIDTPNEKQVLDEKFELILAATQKFKKDASMLVSGPEDAAKWAKRGVQMLAYSSDTEILSKSLAREIDLLKGRAAS